MFNYSKQHLDYLREHYTRLSRAQLTVAFNQAFALNKTKAQITSTVKNHKIQSGRTGGFEKGHPSWNKGTKGLKKGSSTSFKKGNVPVNIKPLGHERIDVKDGYILIKIAETNPHTGAATRYKAKHQVVYEQNFGPIPEGHLVTFIDGDKLNCEPENLEAISKVENIHRNKLGLNSAHHQLKPSIRALAKLEVQRFEAQRAK